VFFQYGQVETDFETAGVSDRLRRAWHIQAGYQFVTPWYFSVTPAYRYAYYDPWAEGGDGLNYELNYHTMGLQFAHSELPMRFIFNYTFTGEEPPREVDNDWLQLLAQVEF
jgi:hypothetical protein